MSDSKERPIIIGVSGGSGVGKSFLSNALQRLFGIEDCTVLSTDDLHKYERGDSNWQTTTHLNPEANNIDLGLLHLKQLKNGLSIQRSVYCHKTGKHLSPVNISPSKFIVHEGLHGFYGKEMSQLCDVRIFIETTDRLKKHWKICRDITKRGYKVADVLKSMERRLPDYEKHVLPQKNSADLVVYLSESKPIKNLGDADENIRINTKFFVDSYHTKSKLLKDIINFLDTDSRELNDFIYYSKEVGLDDTLVTISGGNTSIKKTTGKNLSIRNVQTVYIKSSGSKLKYIDHANGYSSIPYFKNKRFCTSLLGLEDRRTGDNAMYERFAHLDKKPSMEYGLHLIIPSKAIVHTHPVYLNAILCSKNSKSIIDEVFKGWDYGYVEYAAPGFDLTKAIYSKSFKEKTILFLENHGLIVGDNTMKSCVQKTKRINEKCKYYLSQKIEDFIQYSDFRHDTLVSAGHVMPDSVVFDNNMPADLLKSILYIEQTSSIIDTIRYLPPEEISYISKMAFEKHRARV